MTSVATSFKLKFFLETLISERFNEIAFCGGPKERESKVQLDLPTACEMHQSKQRELLSARRSPVTFRALFLISSPRESPCWLLTSASLTSTRWRATISPFLEKQRKPHFQEANCRAVKLSTVLFVNREPLIKA